MMKKLLLSIVMSFALAIGFAQTLVDEDYRTAKASGNWSDADMWEKRTAGVWAVTGVAPTATNNVYVQTGHTVTVDIANAYCKDLQLSIGGVLAIGENTVNVNGKIRAFNNPAVTGASDGNYTTNATALVSTMISTSGSGLLKFVGGTRTITATGEWFNATTNNAVEFALNADAVGTIVTGVKFRPITISSGTVVSDGLCSPGSGDFTIKSGATFKSSRSGSVIWNSSASKMATLTIEEGATLELTGNSPTIDATAIVNSGTVVYSSASSQNMLKRSDSNTDGSVVFDSYYNLKFSNTGTKQLPAYSVKVANSLQTEGTATISNSANSGSKIIMANNSTIIRNGTGSITSAVFEFGATETDLINVSIGNTVTAAGEMISSPAPGSIGNLTITSSGNYTLVSSRNVVNVINDGILTLNPNTTMTLNVNGNISGAGSITGHTNASLNFSGNNDGDAGILRFAEGSQNLNRLTINRTGNLSSVTLGTPLVLNENLQLTNGILHILPGQTLTMSAVNNIAGSSFSSTKYINTQSAGSSVGKFIINGVASSTLIPVGHNGVYLPVTLAPTTASNFEINVFAGATADATPTGVALTAAQKLRMVDAVWNINRTAGSGDADVTLGWDDASEGVDFSGFSNEQIGVASYISGAFGIFTGSGNAANNTAALTTSIFSPFIVGEANTTLPLTLLSFTAKESLNSVMLNWQTTSEVNLSNYILQHGGENGFEDIYNTPAKNQTGILNYAYTHLNPVAGTNYYRLIGVDKDGTQHISEIIPVTVKRVNVLKVYPNPVSAQALVVSGLENGDVIKILNIQGQVLITKNAGDNLTQEIDLQQVQAGTYILRIENQGKVTGTEKIIKM